MGAATTRNELNALAWQTKAKYIHVMGAATTRNELNALAWQTKAK
jgi:hypothetical protein